MLIYSMAALLLGFCADLLLGDPRGFPHIVIGIGKLIAFLEKGIRGALPKTPKSERTGGVLLVIATLLISTLLPFCLLFVFYRVSPWLGMTAEAFLCYQLLAVKSLRDESRKVYRSLIANDLAGARRDVSMIVGRDTQNLTAEGVAKAAIETVAENTADGVIAPLFYMMLGGAVLGCFYKAVNTMDSMVGYQNERYLDFGRAAAKLDDGMNFIPARLAAQLMILASKLDGLDAKNARRIYQRDKKKHASPNSAHTEAVCAGALHVRLGGDAYYFGKLVHKGALGDGDRPIKPSDICRANRLLYLSSGICLLLCILGKGALLWI